ncbi:MAG: transcriptional repressor [Firmicutes bacterium]|nr:transcriptional repressor [Bacillota bacterium]
MEDKFVLLKEQGYKLTRQRCEILDTLEDSPPLMAEEIFRLVNKHCKVDLSTVYRNLSILQKIGLIRKVNSFGQADQYELAKNHCKHDLECLRCGAKVVFSECIFDQLVKEIELKTRYKVKKHNLELYGTCPDCSG